MRPESHRAWKTRRVNHHNHHHVPLVNPVWKSCNFSQVIIPVFCNHLIHWFLPPHRHIAHLGWTNTRYSLIVPVQIFINRIDFSLWSNVKMNKKHLCLSIHIFLWGWNNSIILTGGWWSSTRRTRLQWWWWCALRLGPTRCYEKEQSDACTVMLIKWR